MSDMKVGLSVTATGKQAQRELRKTAKSSDALGQSVKGVGTAAAGAGAKVKKAAREQSEAVRKSARRTTEAMGQIKRGGSEAGRAIRQGMREGVRAERDATRATDRLGTSVTRMIRRVGGSGGAFRKMARAARSEINSIKRSLDSTRGKLAALGVGFAVGREVIGSAKRDRTYIQMQQTADMSPKQRESVRANAWRLARKYGVSESSLEQAQGTLLAKGFKQKTVHSVMDAVARTSAVTGSSPSTLANVAATAGFNFKIDLNDTKAVQRMMDQMTVATRAGGMEMEDLAQAVPIVGPQASMMGLNFPRALALLEVLSKSQPNSARNADATMAGLRLFTRKPYRDQLVKATGDKYLFFDKQGHRKTPESVLAKLREKYAGATNAKGRADLLAKLTKHMESRSVHWLANMLKADNQVDNKSILAAQMHASGTVQKSLPENLNTATATAGRLKATFGQAMDEMSRPINKVFADVGGYMVEHFSGKEMLAAGAATAIAAPIIGRLGKGVLGKILGGGAGVVSTMRGIAVGHTLQEATGTLPVFVTNWSGAGLVAGKGKGNSGTDVGGEVAKDWVLWRLTKRFGKPLLRGGLRLLQYAEPAIQWGLKASPYLAAASLSGATSNSTQKANNARWMLESKAAQGDPTAVRQYLRTYKSGWWHDASASARDAKVHALVQQGLARHAVSGAVGRVVKGTPFNAWMRTHGSQYNWLERMFNEPRADYGQWTAAQARKLVDSDGGAGVTDATRQAADALNTATEALKPLVGQPLHIEVTTDNPALHAQIVDHAEREARRG